MPALSRRSFVTLTALASSSILLSPRAFAGSGATSAAGKPQETFLDFNESPYGPSAKARAAMQRAAALCGRYDYDAQDALVGLFAKQNGIPPNACTPTAARASRCNTPSRSSPARSAAWSSPIPPTTPWSAPPRPRGRRSLPCRWTPRRPTTSSACSPPRNATPG
ncbi:aminotransferase [Pseudomonas aeruginosa]|nr:aminotransferase [Pseudomonas aeruginosa]